MTVSSAPKSTNQPNVRLYSFPQASSGQVNDASQTLGATIETRVVNEDDAFDYECQIVRANRSYDNDGEDLLGQGFFILEVEVEQVVYVVSTDALSDKQVSDVVENGFNRGAGGRVTFRNLLKANSAFSTVLNVEVLDGLSPPQDAPSPSPSASPTFQPSMEATDPPNLSPSLSPTLDPTHTVRASSSPSMAPTLRSSAAPSTQPSVSSSEPPSSKPTLYLVPPTFAPSASGEVPAKTPTPSTKNDRRPLILGAIAGGVATILVSCFFIFCVWFPFCIGYKDEDSSIEEADERKRASTYNTIPSAGTTLIPGMVQLDDHQSIANTSIGDHTAGGLFRTQAPSRLVRDETVRILDSFDESSLYTSTASQQQAPSSTGAAYKGPIDVDRLDEEKGEEKGDEVSSNESETYPFFDVKKPSKSMDAMGSQKSAERPRTGEDFTTKGFDPFLEDLSALKASSSSSNEFANDEDAGSSFGVVTDGGSVESNKTTSLSSQSNVKQMDVDDAPPIQETMQAFDSGDEAPVVPDESVASNEKTRDDPASPIRTEERKHNNSLLRAVLEDARLLSQSKSSSNSRVSRRSAPSRLAARRKKSSKHSIVVPIDLLADNHELEEALSLKSFDSRQDARSMGAHPRSRTTGRAKERDGDEFENEMKNHPYLSHFLGMPSRSTLRHFVRASGATRRSDLEDNGAGSTGSGSDSREGKSKADESASEDGLRSLGAQPRQKWMMSPGETKETETPASSPGVLGIAGLEEQRVLDDASVDSDGNVSNPWLMGTPERRTRTGSPKVDMGSEDDTSQHSSISNRSVRSNRSTRSAGSRQSEMTAPRNGYEYGLGRYLSHQSPSSHSHPSTLDPMINGEIRSSRGLAEDIVITPRTLEHDLKRLEIELAEVLRPENDLTATSSIAASSAGASRSTLSSRVTAKRSKRKRIVVVVPPGKLGVVLADRHDGKGTVVSEVRSSSAMSGLLSPGDKLGECAAFSVLKEPIATNLIPTLLNGRSYSRYRWRRCHFNGCRSDNCSDGLSSQQGTAANSDYVFGRRLSASSRV